MFIFCLLAFLMSVRCMPQDRPQAREILFKNNRDDFYDNNRKIRIPFRIDARFSEQHREVILEGLADYEQHTCLKFEEIGPHTELGDHFFIVFAQAQDETHQECNNTQYLQPVNDEIYNVVTVISLNENVCLNDTGRIEQLIFSTLGFIHENKRSDRDDYITVLWDNIKLGREGIFRKNKENVKNWILPYDFRSISNHYSHFHSKAGKPTLMWKDPNRPYERNIKLSPIDVYKINDVFCKHNSISTTDNHNHSEIFDQFGKFHIRVSFIDDPKMIRNYKQPRGLRQLY